ncbi:MAG: hypothetical protein GWN86_27715 [Desulfobacterales bacterium]|nr:hypothetical protein [Desulfobacterales bacterium]
MKLQTFVQGTQRGYAYGLCDERGRRYIEEYVHITKTQSIDDAYQEASRNVASMLSTWQRRPDLLRAQTILATRKIAWIGLRAIDWNR